MPYINKGSSLKGVSANDHSRFDLHCEGAKNTDGQLHACIRIINRVRDHFVTCTQGTSYDIRIIKALHGLLCPCIQVTKWSLTLLIMQMNLQSILRCEKVIGRPCVLAYNWIICINYYSLCSS